MNNSGYIIKFLAIYMTLFFDNLFGSQISKNAFTVSAGRGLVYLLTTRITITPTISAIIHGINPKVQEFGNKFITKPNNTSKLTILPENGCSFRYFSPK